MLRADIGVWESNNEVVECMQMNALETRIALILKNSHRRVLLLSNKREEI
jgi:hypothetical protein